MPVQPIPQIVEDQIMAVINGEDYTHPSIGQQTITAGDNQIAYGTAGWPGNFYGSEGNAAGGFAQIQSLPYNEGSISNPVNDGVSDRIFIFVPATLHDNEPLLRNSGESPQYGQHIYVSITTPTSEYFTPLQIYIWDDSQQKIFKAQETLDLCGAPYCNPFPGSSWDNGTLFTALQEQEQGPCEIIINEFFKQDINADGPNVIPDFVELQNTDSVDRDLSNFWINTPSGKAKLNPQHYGTSDIDYDLGYNPNPNTSWNGFVKENFIPAGGYFWIISNAPNPDNSTTNNDGIFEDINGDTISIQDYVTSNGDWSCGADGGNFNPSNCFAYNPVNWSGVHTTYTSFNLPYVSNDPNQGFFELWDGDPDSGGTLHCKIEYEFWSGQPGNFGVSYEYAGDTDISDNSLDIQEIRENVNDPGFWRPAITYQQYIDCIQNQNCTGIPDGVLIDNDGGDIKDYFNPSFVINANGDDDLGFPFPSWWITELGLVREDFNFDGNYATPLAENSTAVLLVTGCTDESACNENSYATVDDGSCTYNPFLACLDSDALNYDDEGACTEADDGLDEFGCVPDTSTCKVQCQSTDGNTQDCCEYPAGIMLHNMTATSDNFQIKVYPSYSFDGVENIQLSNLRILDTSFNAGTPDIENDGSDGNNVILNYQKNTGSWNNNNFKGIYGTNAVNIIRIYHDREAMKDLAGQEMCLEKLAADDNGSEGTAIYYQDEDAPQDYASQILYPCQDNNNCQADETNEMGTSSNHKTCFTIDCNGQPGGTATLDSCGVCSGGTTDHVADSDIDSCGVCGGDGKGYCFNGGTCVDGTWDNYETTGEELSNYNYGANPGTCTCVDDTFAGPVCQCSNASNCNNHGQVSGTISDYTLNSCSCVCEADGNPVENGYCNDGSTDDYVWCDTQFDCALVCDGDSARDVCGECNGSGTEWGGFDEESSFGTYLGVDDGDGTDNYIGITCTCPANGGYVIDYCGICGGYNTTDCVYEGNTCVPFQHTDCVGTGTYGGDDYAIGYCDACGECFGTTEAAGSNPSTCLDDGSSCSNDSDCSSDDCDYCGICGGENVAPSNVIGAQCDCNGGLWNPYDPNVWDECGVCGGDGQSCIVTCTDSNANNYDAGSCSQYVDPFQAGYCIHDGTNESNCTYQILGEDCTGDATCDGDLVCCEGKTNTCQGTSGSSNGTCSYTDGTSCTTGDSCCSGVCINGTCAGVQANNSDACAGSYCGTACSANSDSYLITNDDGQYEQQCQADVNGGCSTSPPIPDWNPTISFDGSNAICTSRGSGADPDCQANCLNGTIFLSPGSAYFYRWGVCTASRELVVGDANPTNANACCSNDKWMALNYNINTVAASENDCVGGLCDECGVCRDPECAADTNKTYYTVNPCPSGEEPQNPYWNSTCLDDCNIPNGSSTTGCMDSQACNYEPAADCNPDNVCEYPGGQAVDGFWTDSNNYGEICHCDGIQVWGCDAVCGSNHIEDICGQCVLAPGVTDISQCDDQYGECPDDYSFGCDGECYLDTYLANDGHSEILTSYPGLNDSCGICGGDNSTCAGCQDNQACNYDALNTLNCTYATTNNSTDNSCCNYPTAPNDCTGNCCTAANNAPECDYHGQDYIIDCNGECDGSNLTTGNCNVCNDGGTDTAVTCASAGDGTIGSYCGDTLYCQNLATGETSSDGLGALSSCPTLDVCLRCSDLGYNHPDACAQNSGIGAEYSGTPVEGYCCDCDGQLWDCCGECGGDGTSCHGICDHCNVDYPDGACDCDNNIETDCGCGATASLACVDTGAEHQYCDDTRYCPDDDSDGSDTCVNQDYWNNGTPYCDCDGNAINGFCNGDGNFCNGSVLDVCGECGGDSSSCEDCAGVPNGNALIDVCGNCVGGTSDLLCPDGTDDDTTCSNTSTQSYYVDCANVCYQGTKAGMDLDDSTTGNSFPAALDDCGVCSGGNTGHVANSDANSCGVCPNNNCINPNGLNNGQESCGNTFGYPSDGSDLVHNGVTWSFSNSTDCENVCFGFSETYTYPNGSGQGCCDETELSNCGICDADDNVPATYPNQWNGYCDCNGDVNGTANFDDCQICSGGETGHEANSDLDFCGNCHAGPLNTHGFGWNEECGVYFRFKHSSLSIDTDNMKGSVDIEIKRGALFQGGLSTINLVFDSGTDCGAFGCNGSSTISLNGNTGDIDNLSSDWQWVAGDSNEFSIVADDESFPADWVTLLTLNFNIIEENLSNDGLFEFSFNLDGDLGDNHLIIDSSGAEYSVENSNLFFESDGTPSENIWISERIGCMDILATNCDSESCGCISAGDLTCIEHSKQSYCTYPSVDSINVYVGGVCSEDSQTLCFNDSQCSGTCDVTTDTGLLQEVSDGDTDNILLSRNDGWVWHQNHKHKFLFSTTRLDENISYWNSDYYLVEKSLEYKSPGGNWQLLVDANDNLNYLLGTQFNEVFDASSIVWDYLANPGSTKPIGSGEYRLRVRWPLSSINATPISTQSFNFNIEKKGCRDSSNSNFCDYGYNPFADIDCNDVYNGSNYETCCQMTDYLNSCCYLNEDDACGICPDSETYDTLVETWQDTDNDGIGCASSMVEYCPNQNIPSGRFTIDELTGLELGEACICNEANGFYTDDICYEAGVHEMCVTEQGTTNADDCGVCPYYTIGSTLLSTSLLNGDDFNVYYNNSADCAGICYDGFKPIQEIGGLLDRWSFITNAESFTGYNQLQLVGNDNNSITFDGGVIVNDTGDSIQKNDLFGMGNCDGETYNPERPYDNCPSHNIRTWSYWFSSDVSQTHISTEWRNPSNNDDFDHEVNIGMFQSNKIQIKWTNQNHNNDGGTQSPITVNSVSVDDYINGTLNDSQWHHVVVSLASEEYCISNPTITNVLGQTFDCETNKFIIFVDGLNFTPEIQNTPYTNMRYHHSLLVASGAGTGMGGGWTGKIKELRLYDKPLTAPETQALYLGTGGIMIGTEGHTFGSFEDDCLICSGGESNHIENENLDDCGTCHTPLTSQPPHFGTATDDPEGDWNAVCSDCWGTPNGDSSFLTDACGICTCPSGGNCTDLNGNVNDNLPNIGTCIDGTPNAGQSCLQFDYTANGYDAEVSGCGVGTANTDCFVEGPDAGCGGVCFVYDTLDDINQCCLDGSKILVYPDYDLTAYSSPGIIGDGNCYLADVNENHNGCTGETGFCLDEDCFNPSGPVDETYCVDVCGSTWISAKTLTVCDPNIPGMQQPPIYFTGNIPSLNEEQVSPAGYPYDAGDGWLTAGEFLYYITTDVCLGYYDYCNECFSEEYLINNNLEIGDVYNQGVTCTGNCYDGYKEDSCEIWIGAGNEYQCRHPECVDFGYCSDNSGDDYNSCSANWIEYSFPEDYITFITENPNAYPPLIPLDGTTLEIEADNENYLSDACSTSDCPSGNCIPTNPLWNYTCTGCTDDQAKSTSYNEPCRTTHGLDGCLFDDGSCLYDIPIIESIDTVYIGPGGETIQGVISNDIITEPVKFNIQFLGDNYFKDLGLTIKRSPDNSVWYDANLISITQNTGTENQFYFEDWFAPETMGAYTWPNVEGDNVVTLYYKVELSGVSAGQDKVSETISVNILKSSPTIDIVVPATDATAYSSHDSIPIELDYNGLYTADSYITEDKIQLRLIKPDGESVILKDEFLPIDIHTDWDGSGEQTGYFYCPLDAPYGNDTNYYTSGIHIQFTDQGTCDTNCVSPNGDFATCVSYHNIWTNLGYRWGWLWNILWEDESGNYTLQIEYPSDLYSCNDNSYCGNSSDDYAVCEDGTTECTPTILAETSFDVTVVSGCIYETTNGYDGACNCVSCPNHDCCINASYNPCDDNSNCSTNESCVPSPIGNICQPDSCFDEGFYNPYASVGFCDDGNHCHGAQDCSDGSLCSFGCELPIGGCTDDGDTEPGRCVTSDGTVTETRCYTDPDYSYFDECHTLLDGTHSCQAQWYTFKNSFFGFGSPHPDFAADNYNPDATYNDGSCDGYGPICIYDEAINFYANTDITGWNVAQSQCVDNNGNAVLIADTYNELFATGDVTCTPPVNGNVDNTITPAVMASTALTNLLEMATDGGENDCVYGFTYKIGYEIFLLSGGETLGEATLEHNGYVFLYDTNENIIYDNLQQNSDIPLLIRKPRSFADGGPAGVVLKLWVEGPSVGDTGVAAKSNVKLMPAYTSEPGFPISDAMSGESWTVNGDSLVADNELCTEAGSECTGEPSEPIYLRVNEYNPLVPGGMDDTSDVFEVTLTDPQSYGDGQYLSVTKSLYVTYIRNNYWSGNPATEEQGPVTLTYNPEGDESSDMLIDVGNVFGDNVDCSNPSDCIAPYTFTIQDLDSDLVIVDATITPYTGLDGAISATPTQWIYNQPNDGSGGQTQENSIQFTINDTGNQSPAGIYTVRLVASYAKLEHSTYDSIVYDYMLDDWCEGNLDNDDSGICNGFESGHIVHNTPFIIYPQEQFIYTFNLNIVDTRGPQGEIVYNQVESFGISPDTWNFRPSGGDSRSILYKQVDEVVGVDEQANITAGFGVMEYNYDPNTNNVLFKCITSQPTLNLIDFGYDQAESENIFTLFDAASYEVNDNLYDVNGNGNIVFDGEGVGFCSEDTLITYVDEDTGETIYNEDRSGSECQVDGDCQINGQGGTCIPWQEGVNGIYDFQDAPFIHIQNQFPTIYGDGIWNQGYNCFSYLSDTLVYDYVSPITAVEGDTIEYDNPNSGGFFPKNADTDPWDTIWKYELSIFRCDPEDGMDCYTENAELLDYRVWQDHGDPPPMGTYHQLELYIPPQGGNSQWEDWWTGPWQNMWSIFGHNDYSPECPYNFTDGIPDDEFGFQPDSEGGGSYPECYPHACVTNSESDLSQTYGQCGGTDNWKSVWGGTVKGFIETGHTYRFTQEGLHKAKICAYDLSWDPYGLGDGTEKGCVEQEFNIDYIIPIQQSVKENYNPWKGINVPLNDLNLIDVPLPKAYMIEHVDLDQRPSLGTYTFIEDNPWYLDWNAIALDNIGGNFGRQAPSRYCSEDYTIDSYVENYEEICETLGGNLLSQNGVSFSPDADVRSIQTLVSGSSESSAYEYYDETLQRDKYFESAAPSQIQFYFYPRKGNDLYKERDFFGNHLTYNNEPLDFDKNNSKWYIAFLDFGDGTEPLYTTSPLQLHMGQYIKHTYQKSGIYTVTGWMFHVAVNSLPVSEDTVRGVTNYKKFRTIINLHSNPYHEDEFEALGGADFTFIPSKNTSPVVGGISPNSVYAKTLIRKLGYSGITNQAKVKYQLQSGTYMEQLNAEYALAKINENLVGSEISKFTGSFAHEVNINGSYPIESDSFITEYGTGKVYYSNQVTGFISGSNIDDDGSVIYDANDPPILVNKGWFTNYGELGDDIGNADIGQVRYFQHPMSMWEMLGFEDTSVDIEHAGNPQSPRYWENIKPTPYELWEREGITMDSNIPGKISSIDVDATQQWVGNNVNLPNDSETYYYPVLPKLNKFKRFDESLGLQTDSSGNEKIPFGSISYWKDKDEKAPITNNNFTNEYLLMDLDFKNLNKSAVQDKSGTSNLGVLIGDYKVKYDDKGLSSRGSQATIAKLNKDGKQY